MSQTRNGNQNETTGFSSHFATRLFTPARYRFCCVLCVEIVKNENRKIHFQLDNKFLFCVLMLWATKATYKTRFHSVIYSFFIVDQLRCVLCAVLLNTETKKFIFHRFLAAQLRREVRETTSRRMKYSWGRKNFINEKIFLVVFLAFEMYRL